MLSTLLPWLYETVRMREVAAYRRVIDWNHAGYNHHGQTAVAPAKSNRACTDNKTLRRPIHTYIHTYIYTLEIERHVKAKRL